MSDKQGSCKYCHQTVVIDDNGYFDKFENQIELATGGWTALSIGVDVTGCTVMRACGDGFTDDYKPKYCPECGRKLVGEEDG